MSRSKRDTLATEKMLERLTALLGAHHFDTDDAEYHRPETRADAEALRRISMTLHNWHELECGTDQGHIERDEKTNAPMLYSNARYLDPNDPQTRHAIPDREAGAQKRLKRIMRRYPTLTAYVQSDPRGCALYILKPGDVPEGKDISAYYSRGLAVHQ